MIPAAIIFYVRTSGTPFGFDTIVAAKESALRLKKSFVIRRDKQTKKFFINEAFITDNIPINIGIAETPFGKAVAGAEGEDHPGSADGVSQDVAGTPGSLADGVPDDRIYPP